MSVAVAAGVFSTRGGDHDASSDLDQSADDLLWAPDETAAQRLRAVRRSLPRIGEVGGSALGERQAAYGSAVHLPWICQRWVCAFSSSVRTNLALSTRGSLISRTSRPLRMSEE